MPSHYSTHHLPAPEKGKKPEKITTKNPPGGPSTPGAKAKTIAEIAAEGNKEHERGTSRSR